MVTPLSMPVLRTCFFALLIFFCRMPTPLYGYPSLPVQEIARTIWLAAGEDLSLQKNHFSIYDKVYLIVRFQQLAAGSYTLQSDWLNPEGEVEQRNSHTFSLKNQTKYTYYAWLSLLKNGPFKQMLTGSDIDRTFMGTWQLQVFVNGQILDTLEFTMH